MLEWKSFHLSEYCCSPLDEDEEAAMASVPSGPTAEGTRGAIVLTLAPHGDTFTSPSRRVSPRTPLFLSTLCRSSAQTNSLRPLLPRPFPSRTTREWSFLEVKRSPCFFSLSFFRPINLDLVRGTSLRIRLAESRFSLVLPPFYRNSPSLSSSRTTREFVRKKLSGIRKFRVYHDGSHNDIANYPSPLEDAETMSPRSLLKTMRRLLWAKGNTWRGYRTFLYTNR